MSRRAKEAAGEILRRFGSQVPVDVTSVVKAHGITVLVEDVEVSLSGMLVIKPEHTYVVLNQLHPTGRMRFSLAHELGHYLLHRDTSSVFIDETPLFYRDERSKEGTDPLEVEANAFAAELLMPEDVLRAEFGANPLSAEDEDGIRELAARYGVSSAAMVNRLKNLKLTGPKT
jgi:Zn-dependent peptidase ImmA (M78 family)